MGRRVWGVAFAAISLFCTPLAAQIQMPDPKQMSGIPRPVDDLPAGSLSVRLIKGDLANNIAGHPVELHVGDKVQTVKTDAAGRAQFDQLPAGATLKAIAVVDGERLESQEFPAPSRGGIRLMLVATDKEKERQKAEEAKAPPISGQVVVGGESRIVIEPGEESLALYYILEIINTARAPVNPPVPFAFEMPEGSRGTSVMTGSSPLAMNTGNRILVNGPFPSGTTSVQIGADLPITGGTMEITQRLPATLESLVVIAKKSGDGMKLVSPQIDRQEDRAIEGTTVIIGAGGTIPEGQPIALTLSGLPHYSPVPGRTALTLASLVAIIGIWAAARRDDPAGHQDERKRLVARREKLFQDLVRLENDNRRGRLDSARYAGRRNDLLTALEHLYGALDTDDAGPEPAGRNTAATPLDEVRAS